MERMQIGRFMAILLPVLATVPRVVSPSQLTDGTITIQTAEDLSCFQCSTVNSTDNCYNVTKQHGNVHIKQCKTGQQFCQVKRISYLITDSIEEEGYVPWSLERSCSDVCQEYCVTMGARTKVTYCTSCCSEDTCNTDYGHAHRLMGNQAMLKMALLLQIVFILIYKHTAV